MVAGYVRIAVELCGAFYISGREKHPGVTFGDYMLEAQWAIWDAMYSYDGSTRFCTYCYWAIKNRLIEFNRGEERASGVGRTVRILRRRVNQIMAERQVGFDQALRMIISEDGLSPELVAKLQDAMYVMSRFEDNGKVVAPQESAETQAMREAVQTTKLDPLERELIEAHLNGDRGFRTQVCRTRMNPSTGELYTRQRLSQIFIEACKKCQATFEGRPPAAAAA